MSSSNLTTKRPWESASKDHTDDFVCVCYLIWCGVFIIMCPSCLRACASAALKDVATYFTKEQGQVAVSKRTTEPVPLFTIKHTLSLCLCETETWWLLQVWLMIIIINGVNYYYTYLNIIVTCHRNTCVLSDPGVWCHQHNQGEEDSHHGLR